MTRNQRCSFLGIGLAAAILFPTADGSFNAPDRRQILGTYRGSDTEIPPAVFPAGFFDATQTIDAIVHRASFDGSIDHDVTVGFARHSVTFDEEQHA